MKMIYLCLGELVSYVDLFKDNINKLIIDY